MPRRLATFQLFMVFLVAIGTPSCAKKDTARNNSANAADSSADSPDNSTSAGESNSDSADIDADSDPSATALLKKMKETYATCDAYADHGTARTTLKIGDNPNGFSTNSKFFTNFVRPDCIRIEVKVENSFAFGRPPESIVLWGRGSQTRNTAGFSLAMLDGGDDEDEESAEEDATGDADDAESKESGDQDAPADPDAGDPRDAEAGDDEEPVKKRTSKQKKPKADPVAEAWSALIRDSAAVSEVPAWLLPDRAGPKRNPAPDQIDSLRGLKFHADEEVDGAMCRKVTGIVPKQYLRKLPRHPLWRPSKDVNISAEMTLWIDRKLGVLRKTEQAVHMRDMGEVEIVDGEEVKMPDMHIEVAKTYAPRLDAPRWHELEFGGTGEEPDDDLAVPCFAGPTFVPTRKAADAARKQAKKIMNDVARRYAGCKSYRDTGVTETVAINRDEVDERRVEFKTAFVRPGKFRFAYTQTRTKGDDLKQVHWSDGESKRSWSSQEPQPQDHETFDAMIHATPPFASTPVLTIPGLLFPEHAGQSFLGNLKEVTLLGSDKLDGIQCHKLRGRSELSGLKFSIWVEKESNLIRRIETRVHDDGTRMWLTTTYKPVMDKKVSRKLLAPGPIEESQD